MGFFKENWKNIIALLFSYLILFFLPKQLSGASYILLGISVFLFAIGFFRMTEIFDAMVERIGYVMTDVICNVFGLSLMIIGTVIVVAGKTDGRSMVIAYLLLVEGLVIMTVTSGDYCNLKVDRIMSVIIKIVVLGLLTTAILYIRANLNQGSLAAGLIIVECIILWFISNMMSYKKRIAKMKTPVQELCEKFGKVETPLGPPRVGSIGKIKECIIYGPNEDGIYVYGYYKFRFFFLVLDLEGKQEIMHHDTDILDSYADMFENYVETGKARY